jgi:hypothetical protein
MSVRTTIALTLAAAAATTARAGVITGRVVDSGGAPVANANLDFKLLSSGGGVTELNDGTDANGYFTTTVTPNGVYRVTILPPPPPASTALTVELDNVAIGSVPNQVGTIVAPLGVALTGRCVSSSGAAVAGVDLDVLDAGGDSLTVAGDSTSASGQFSIAVPMGPIEVRFDTTPVVGPMLAPATRALDLAASFDAGDVVLAPGFALSAIVRRQSNGSAVQDVDVDVVDSASGERLFTPGDNTDSAGFVDVVVPAGTFDVRFEAPFALQLVGLELDDRAVAGSTFLGTQYLANGVVLSGTVAGFDGSVHGGVDVDVKSSATGVGVYLGHDNTNASGAYQVIVPTGTFDVTFSPPLAIPFGAVTYPGVAISANKVQNGTLPSCPFFTTVGTGIPGLGDVVPAISASGGAPRVGNAGYSIDISQGRGGAKAIVVYSLLPTPNPLPNPCQVVPPMQRRLVQLGGAFGEAGAGAGRFAFPIDPDPALAGFLIRAWFYVRDSTAVGGLSRTHELRATICL